MRILVTGANGYLGSGVVKELLNLGHEVIATDFSDENIDKRATVISCNLFDIHDPFTFFKKPDVLLHMAWRNGFIHNSDTHISDLPKHFEFIQKMSYSSIKTIVSMGTMHEIGFFEGKIDENTPCRPSTLYGISKNALRELSKYLCSSNNKTFLWLRGYYIVGNPEIGNSIFSKIYSSAKRGEKHFPFTSGKNKYDFLNYDDFCKQVALACSQDSITGIINICSGEPICLAERVESFIKECNLDIKLDYGSFPDRPYDSKCIYGDNSKILKIMRGI